MELHDYIKPAQPPQVPPPPPLTGEQMLLNMGHPLTDLFSNHSPGDSRLWQELYFISAVVDIGISDRLEFVRNVGAVLIMDDQWGFRIQPVIDSTGRNGWNSMQEYLQTGQVELRPYGDKIMQFLKELRRRYDNNLIKWW